MTHIILSAISSSAIRVLLRFSTPRKSPKRINISLVSPVPSPLVDCLLRREVERRQRESSTRTRRSQRHDGSESLRLASHCPQQRIAPSRALLLYDTLSFMLYYHFEKDDQFSSFIILIRILQLFVLVLWISAALQSACECR